ncbi:MAG: NAD(+)/NADH kinase [Gemmatimonadetes bacterium]|jgi:NAD+ kinase|nr:NAD(+)/NADH kinase [Gemmatimonadota bacterium]
MTHAGVPMLSTPVRTIGVVLRRRSHDVAAVVERLVEFCRAHGVALAFEAGAEEAPAGSNVLDVNANSVDLLLSLGGDGTMLRAARLGMSSGTPVFGVNLGRLGFLTATPGKLLEAGLEQILLGEAHLDRRFTLQATVMGPDGVVAGPFQALNDIVVHTVGAARVSALNLSVGRAGGHEEIGSISADGVILTTPTGSTAYSLSAGGPIIAPDVECIVVTAICPHSLTVRPLVVPASEEIMVRTMDPHHDLQVTVDGQVERALHAQESVIVARGPHTVPLVRLSGQTFFETMRTKLNWAASPPERA